MQGTTICVQNRVKVNMRICICLCTLHQGTRGAQGTDHSSCPQHMKSSEAAEEKRACPQDRGQAAQRRGGMGSSLNHEHMFRFLFLSYVNHHTFDNLNSTFLEGKIISMTFDFTFGSQIPNTTIFQLNRLPLPS